MKKKIGISFSTTGFQNYWNWFTEKDLKNDIELVELSFQKNNVEDIPCCDGFLLTGGVDIHPSLYGSGEDYLNKPTAFQPERDQFEKKIYTYSQTNKIPLLAICRGLQLVNVLNGGKLIQDLGEGNLIHTKENNIDKQHVLKIESGTLLDEITTLPASHINSAHHQAIHHDEIGNNLMANAYAEGDSIIEGLEYKVKSGKAFMLCLQWHPERLDDKDNHPLSKNIKERFLKEVRETQLGKLSITNPATEEIIMQLNQDTKDSVAKKFIVLQAGQKQWQKESLQQRINIVQKFSVLLQQNIGELAAILTSEMGKPLQQARNEINGACTRIKWLTGNAEKYLADELMTDEQSLQEKIVYEALGVVCNISAWNYPYLVGVNVFVPALLGGNAMLYKPSEHATLTGVQIEKLLKEAGVPEDVFQTVVGAGHVGEYLLDLSIDGYFFTGSYKTGKYIYERVAKKMVPCQCELGGKDPLYVADDIVDIKSVAAATADGAFYNNGQSCCSVERIYVHENVYDKYVEEFTKEVKSYKTGQPMEDNIYVGPLSRKQQLSTLQEQVNEAVAKGANILTGGKSIDGTGYYFQPTILANVTHDMQVMTEETFGPVIGIMKVANDDEAIALMQDTDYGLTASVYSSDEERAKNILSQLNTGTGYWNCCDRVSAALPWSGRKHSGIGTSLSHAGLRAFVRPKAYHLRK
jgi:acyl-CoA reductase-like NAD-dependent aldehyde dehydrogenase/gamma-glutamyl-gamma-aminobutyrate hydrolase PuuD